LPGAQEEIDDFENPPLSLTARLVEYKRKYDSNMFWFEMRSQFWLHDFSLEFIPPELHGVPSNKAIPYLLEKFPYPLLRYISPFLVKLQILFPLHYIDSAQQVDVNLTEIRSGTTFDKLGLKEMVVVFSNLHIFLKHYERVRAWFGNVMKLPFFRVRLAPDRKTGPQIEFLLCSYEPIKFLVGTFLGCTHYSFDNFWDVFNSFEHSFLLHGEFQPQFLHEITRPVLRKAFYDYGIRDESDLSLVFRQKQAYPLLFQIISHIWRTKQQAKGLIDDALYCVKLQIGEGFPLSVLSHLFIQLQKYHCTDKLREKLELTSPPFIPNLKRIFSWVYSWLVQMLGICPIIFLQCLATTIFQKSNRLRFIVLHGPPKTGKTLLSSILLDLFNAKNFTREIAYTKGLELFIIDDASDSTFVTLQEHRGVFDKKVFGHALRVETTTNHVVGWLLNISHISI
jgi:hypothetical protein